MDLEVFFPANPERVLQILLELKRQSSTFQIRTSTARKTVDLLTSEPKSDTLKTFLETMKTSNEKIMLTHAFVQDQVTKFQKFQFINSFLLFCFQRFHSSVTENPEWNMSNYESLGFIEFLKMKLSFPSLVCAH